MQYCSATTKSKMNMQQKEIIEGMMDYEVTNTLYKNGWIAHPQKWYVYFYPYGRPGHQYTAHIGYPVNHREQTKLCIYKKGEDDPIDGVISNKEQLEKVLRIIHPTQSPEQIEQKQ